MKLKFLAKTATALVIALTTLASPVLATSYTYDNLNRLTSMTSDSGQNTSFTYDASGNMITSTSTALTKSITTFSLANQLAQATINNNTKTIDITIPSTTDVTNLTATFTLSTNDTAQIATIKQASGVTKNDFTNPVVYTVIDPDTTTQNWTITVTKQAQNTNTLTVSNATTSGFTISLASAIPGLGVQNLIITNSSKTAIPINTVTTIDGGLTYSVGATITTGQIYSLTCTKESYSFGTPQSIVISTGTAQETITLSNTTKTGFTLALTPALQGLQINNLSLVDSSNTTQIISAITTADGGIIYTVEASLIAGQNYTLTCTKNGYDFGQSKPVAIPNENVKETTLIGNINTTGFTLELTTALQGLQIQNLNLTDSINKTIQIT